jgi:hypothetical protein
VREVGVGVDLEYHSGQSQKGCENHVAVTVRANFERAPNEGILYDKSAV